MLTMMYVHHSVVIKAIRYNTRLSQTQELIIKSEHRVCN